MSEHWGIFLVGVLVGGMLNFLVWVALDTYDAKKRRKSYRQEEEQ